MAPRSTTPALTRRKGKESPEEPSRGVALSPRRVTRTGGRVCDCAARVRHILPQTKPDENCVFHQLPRLAATSHPRGYPHPHPDRLRAHRVGLFGACVTKTLFFVETSQIRCGEYVLVPVASKGPRKKENDTAAALSCLDDADSLLSSSFCCCCLLFVFSTLPSHSLADSEVWTNGREERKRRNKNVCAAAQTARPPPLLLPLHPHITPLSLRIFFLGGPPPATHALART